MDDKELQDILAKLNSEIGKAEKDHTKSENLDRLKLTLQQYKEDDRIILTPERIAMIKSQAAEEKILSTWAGLDEILKGFRPGQVVTIAAPTKNGKTSFCMDLTSKLKVYMPLWFAFEEGPEELILKYLERGEEAPMFCSPGIMKGNTLTWIEHRVIESIAKHNTRVVFIDHLHFIVPFAAERQDLRIGETMRKLKALAKRWNIVVFLIAHLKKTKLDTQPDLEDLRDSSFIAQESDTVILLWRESRREKGQLVITSNVNLSVQANRRTGKTGNIKMVYYDGKFVEQGWMSQREEESEESKEIQNKF